VKSDHRSNTPDGRLARVDVLLSMPIGVLASVMLILLATLSPWLGLAPMRIPAAWCLACGGAWVMDAVSNVVLFLPLGMSLRSRAWRVRRVILVAFALSFFVETMQSLGIPPSRSPSVSDLVTNTIGAIFGVLLWQHGRSLLCPTPQQARWLSAGAIAVSVLTLSLTTFALTPRRPSRADATPLRPSRFSYAPGYGWYGGRLTEVVLNGRYMPHHGDGPVVVESSPVPDSLLISATLRGRDAASYTRAMVFVHAADDTLPDVALSQRGDHLELHIERRGSDWGLYMPYVRLPQVLHDRATIDAQPMQINAVATPGHLRLWAKSETPSVIRSLSLSPTLGWSMLQSLIGPTHPMAPVIHLFWLMTLVLPIGWWNARTAHPRAAAGIAMLALAAACVLPAWMVRLPLPSLTDGLTMCALLITGMIVSRRTRTPTAREYISV